MVVFTFRLVIFCIVARFRFGTVLLYFELLYVLNIQTDVLLLFSGQTWVVRLPQIYQTVQMQRWTYWPHSTVKHSENPEKENTQKETRKDTMAKDSVFVELTEEKVMSLLKDTYMVIKNFWSP